MTTSPQTPHDEFVTLAQAAEQLDVHYMTAYRYVRTGRMHAEKRAGQWWVAPLDLQAVAAEGTGRRAPTAQTAKRANLVEPLVGRLISGDTAGCWDLISDALSAGATPAEVHVDLLRTSLERIGEGWRSGEVSVADEHRATATVYRLLGQLGPLFRHRGRRRGSIILGTAEGDMHAIPTAIMADLLSDRHFEAVDLGANTPTESFVSAARSVDNLIGIGICVLLDDFAETALTTLAALRAELPGVLLVAGGPAVHGARHAEFADLADVVSTSAQHACDAFEGSLTKPPDQVAAGA